MSKWMYYAILFSVALVLGVSMPAAAQSKAQQGDAQQQTSQQQKQDNQNNQQTMEKQKQEQSSSQSGDEQASVDSEQKSASSQESQDQKSQGQKSQGQKNLFITSQSSSQELASSIMGMTIKNGTGKEAKVIGNVNDLIMNKQHQLVGIVVGIGGFLGIGEKSVGLKWDAVENIDHEKDIAVVSVSYKQLENAPAFTSKQEKKQKQKRERAQQKAREQQQKMMPQNKQKLQQQQAPAPAPAQGDNAATGG